MLIAFKCLCYFYNKANFGNMFVSHTGIYLYDVGNICQSKFWSQPWQLHFHTWMQVIHALISKETNKRKQPSKLKVLSVANSYTRIGLHCPEYTGEECREPCSQWVWWLGTDVWSQRHEEISDHLFQIRGPCKAELFLFIWIQ